MTKLNVVMAIAIAIVLGSALAVMTGPASAQIALVRIQSLEGSGVPINVQFNPTELTIDKQVPWQKKKKSSGDEPTLEFTASEPKTMDVELLFDLFETGGNVHEVAVKPLEQLTRIDPALKRPPLVLFTWGSLPPFAGVVESLSVKYTLFLPDGTPVRAVCGLRLKHAEAVVARGGVDGAVIRCQTQGDCPAGTACVSGICAPLP